MSAFGDTRNDQQFLVNIGRIADSLEALVALAEQLVLRATPTSVLAQELRAAGAHLPEEES